MELLFLFLSSVRSEEGDCLLRDDGAGEGAVDIAVGTGGRFLVAA